MHSRVLTAALLFVVTVATAQAHDIVRRANSSFPIADSVTVPAGADRAYLSGTLADAADTSAPAGSIERLGDTAAQTKSVLAKIARELNALGLTMADVVKMNVFLVGDPRKGGGMDFEGLMHGYLQHFGAASEKNLPARTTVQVAGLPIPGALVEVEVIAARGAPLTPATQRIWRRTTQSGSLSRDGERRHSHGRRDTQASLPLRIRRARKDELCRSASDLRAAAAFGRGAATAARQLRDARRVQVHLSTPRRPPGRAAPRRGAQRARRSILCDGTTPRLRTPFD